MQLTFHYRQVPEKIRPVMVEKAEKIIAGNGFKVKVVETADAGKLRDALCVLSFSCHPHDVNLKYRYIILSNGGEVT